MTLGAPRVLAGELNVTHMTRVKLFPCFLRLCHRLDGGWRVRHFLLPAGGRQLPWEREVTFHWLVTRFMLTANLGHETSIKSGPMRMHLF